MHNIVVGLGVEGLLYDFMGGKAFCLGGFFENPRSSALAD